MNTPICDFVKKYTDKNSWRFKMELTAASPATQVIIAIIPIVGIVIGGVVVFFYLLWRHREISLQIKTEP